MSAEAVDELITRIGFEPILVRPLISPHLSPAVFCWLMRVSGQREPVRTTYAANPGSNLQMVYKPRLLVGRKR